MRKPIDLTGPSKCSPKAWCAILKYLAIDQYTGGNGIEIVETMNFKSGKFSNDAILRFGRKPGDYIFLSFCPFCGTKILNIRKEKNDQR